MTKPTVQQQLALVATTLAVSHMSTCAAAEYQFVCPSIFPAQAIRFGAVANGWTPFAPSSLPVQEAFIVLGPPQSLAHAKPGTYQNSPKAITATWDLQGSPQLEKWLSCGYGDGHELTLSKQLPRDVTSCTVVASKDKHRGVTGVVATCRSNDK